ncbi:spinocerebellar ataxia type 10 protein domain-containing protein [Rhizoctonia solani]|nr:spinocerebellar ataxia type 10 protein domain-containing protein [Rhizoctonia solani]
MASLSDESQRLIAQMKGLNKELESSHKSPAMNRSQVDVLKKLTKRAKDKEQRTLLGENKDVREAVSWMWFFAESNIGANDTYIDLSDPWAFVCALARFTGNLAAECTNNQNWIARVQLDNLLPRLIAQCLTNTITGNAETSRQIWTTYMALPEKDNIVTRLLQHKDRQAVNVALIFILNSLFTSPSQSLVMAKGEGGRAICSSLLEIVDRTSDEDQREDTFQYIFRIFVQLFENEALSPLYNNLRPAEGIVSPHQITLLKILDGYTYSDPKTFVGNPSISAFLSSTLPKLLQTTQSYTTVDPGSESEFVPSEDLPQVSAATVLVSQALSNALMAEQTTWEMANDKETPGRPVLSTLRDPSISFVELIINVLRRLDQLLPRTQFGKAQPTITGTDGSSVDKVSLPASRFQFQKRDLVRLLGILVHDDPSVQTRVREASGVQLILGLCTIDEDNPFIREHALFTLRNLLHKNLANQRIVQEMEPMGRIDENGILTGI